MSWRHSQRRQPPYAERTAAHGSQYALVPTPTMSKVSAMAAPVRDRLPPRVEMVTAAGCDSSLSKHVDGTRCCAAADMPTSRRGACRIKTQINCLCPCWRDARFRTRQPTCNAAAHLRTNHERRANRTASSGVCFAVVVVVSSCSLPQAAIRLPGCPSTRDWRHRAHRTHIYRLYRTRQNSSGGHVLV